MHILIAPNAFKNSLSAAEAAIAIQKGVLETGSHTCTCFPVADGGDGTDQLITQHCKGKWIETTASDAFGKKIKAGYGLIDNDTTAVIGIAAASGIGLIPHAQLDPLRATSYGTGELINDALYRGVKKIIIAMGGSATVDGGTGILRAAGIRLLDESGHEIILPEKLIDLQSIDVAGIDPRWQQTGFTILCDVDNPLLGVNGAATVFGPQKGASQMGVKQLEAGLAKLTTVVRNSTTKDMTAIPYAGAAGGAAAGIWAFFAASLVGGAQYFLSLTDFAAELSHAQYVITGEGSLDEQTLHGKAPFAVASMAKEKNIRVAGMAGLIPDEAREKLLYWFDELLLINPIGTDRATALRMAATNLQSAAATLARRLS